MTAIAINDLSPRKQHIATAGATTFVYDFPILATADLLVYKTLAANTGDDDDDLLTYGVDYTLTGVGTATGGTIVLTSGAAAGDIITAMRARAYSRAATFSLSAAISSQILDEEMNHLLLLIQQVNAKVEKLQTKYNNCSVLSETKDKILPVLAAKQTWRMNTAGTDIEAMTVEETGEAATLRADLAEATVVADGARLIGFNDGSSGATNVHDEFLRIEPTGMFGFFIGAFPPTGWVAAYGTIGSATSGASSRANSDCEALFTLIWNSISDTQAPVIGGRGASANADWLANKQITLPNTTDRVLMSSNGVRGRTGGSTTVTITTVPYHTHTVVDPTHGHSVNDPGHIHYLYGGSSGSYQTGGAYGASNGHNGSQSGQTIAAATGVVINGAGTGVSIAYSGASEPHDNMMPYCELLGIIKL